ncbi:MAG: hypothetical protein UR60_C0009G0004 [Candidatus Moranbacteria bacterium GW2011_GWF2_34_56]|nr:MAG: hypothetical protein UR51_C0006G0087 [Candidatus Moranbacteria bacterium GW2011_GWF1_34_10]KKP65045.1 MAG: hypothetical protein UR60_C0009G0004 [Candidatus Moranbacteria bacterium GW2011_GWF2_34_56]
MLKNIILIFVGLLAIASVAEAACDCGSINAANPCTGQSISITVTAGTPNGGTAVNSIYNWSFNSGGEDAKCGQFANGDYWIAPASGQGNITLTGLASNGDVSADVNPKLESMGLFGGTKIYGNYNAAENIIPNLPQTYSGITSILAGIKRNEISEGNCGTSAIIGSCADSYNVLTVLSSVPALAGSETLRPNITGETKELLNFDDFDFTRLPAKDFLTGTNTAGFEIIRQRWSHNTEIFGIKDVSGTGYSEGGRAFRAHILVDDYGAGTTASWNNSMMNLFSDDNTLDEKKPALAAMLSYGLDLYHSMNDAPPGVIRYWGQGATQSPGKFLPAVFMASLRTDATEANLLKTVGPNVNSVKDDRGPHELGQIHQGKTTPVWGDFTNYAGSYYLGAYWGSLLKSQCYDGATGICNTGIGKKTQLDPHGYIDGPPNRPGSNYMGSSLGVQKSFMAAMCLMPKIREIVNYENLVIYVNRIVDFGLVTANDPCTTPDSRENLTTCDPYRNTGCLYYGTTWGPINPEDVDSDCIKNPNPPYTKVGRFTALEGNHIGIAYGSGQVESNWTAIKALCGSTSSIDATPPGAPTGLEVI